MISGSPPTLDATTGTSHAMASSAARPKLSCADGSRNRSADESSPDEILPLPQKDDIVLQAGLVHEPFDVGADGPSPTSANLARTRWRMRRNTSSATVDALHRTEVRDVDHERVVADREGRAARGGRDQADADTPSNRGSSGSPRCRGGCRGTTTVSALRLCETAVTPCDCSIENATALRVRRVAADERDIRAVQRRHRPRLDDAWGATSTSVRRGRRPSRAARRSARARYPAARSSATRAMVVVSASRYCGSRKSGYGGTST